MKRILIVVLALSAMAMCGCTTTRYSKTNDCEVVCIGMERSRAFGNCPGAKLDSSNMSRLLSKYGNVTLIQDDRATRSKVKSAMKQAMESKLAIVFYSGHGGSQRFNDTGAEESDGKDEFLCLYDGAMRDNEIWDIICEAKGRVFLIFDCCHSETMFRTAGFTLSMLEGAAMPLDSASTVEMLCWSGCADNTFSYGSATGGELTNAIRRHFAEGKTYDSMWEEIAADQKLKSFQTVKRTKMGSGFDGECFR